MKYEHQLFRPRGEGVKVLLGIKMRLGISTVACECVVILRDLCYREAKEKKRVSDMLKQQEKVGNKIIWVYLG